MRPITKISTPFSEKFGVPRQPLLILEAKGKMIFPKNDFYSEAFRGLEGFSHLWLIFEFHHIEDGNFAALVRPPRFASKRKLGVYATRSPHRPNRLGLSVVKFDKLETTDKEIILWVAGVDLVDGTPILDIKPYVPYCDSVPSATALDFEEPPSMMKVIWMCKRPEEAALIEKVVALDPRPGFASHSLEEFGVSVAGLNIRFKQEDGELLILTVSPL